MSAAYILAKDHLKSFVRKISKGSRLIAPVTNEYGDTLYSEINCLDSTQIDTQHQPQSSIKHFFLPQQESILSYSVSQAGEYHFSNILIGVPTVFFGVRSCDLAGLLYMDVIFSNPAKDPYYFKKRENSIIISLGCNEPFENCFCNATKSGPFLDFGFDLRFTDLGDRFLVEPGRKRGMEILEEFAYFFNDASEQDLKDQYQLQLESRSSFQQNVHVDLAIKKLANEEVGKDVWQDLADRCQDCGGCAYVCPTCTCFTITDQPVSESEGERVRSWDACTFAGFTRMVGGHNPVSSEHSLRRRFLHKLKYDVSLHNRTSCTGCGRCVGICFGGVDIIKFISAVCES